MSVIPLSLEQLPLAMDWGALGSRDAVLAICEHFRIDFAQARDHLLARQLQQAEERAAAAEEVEEEEEEGEDEAAKYTCDTDEGIKECLKEWMSSDAFLNCSDPFAVQLGDVVDFCAFLCDVTGGDKEAWCKTHKQSILPHWKACDLPSRQKGSLDRP